MPYAEVNFSVVATSVALLAGPWLAGVVLGRILVRALGRRATGFVAFAACVALPPAMFLFAVSRAPIVGIWDAVLEGALFGFGLVVATHGAFRDPRTITMVSLAATIGLGAVELASRFLLPEAPAMTMGRVPHLFLVDALRDDERQPGDASMRNVVCRMAYGDSYRPPTDSGTFDYDPIPLPQDADLPDRSHLVLHVGDSMVYGFGVPRDATFAAGLTRLQHDTIHVNAGMPGAGPDAYLVALRSWVSRHHFDLVLMYLFEGNDIRDLDMPFPCTHGETLLTYSADGAALRYRQPSPVDPETPDWTWLRMNSPPPYLVRAALPFSHGARQVAARLILAARNEREVSDDHALRFEHLETILRSGRNDAAVHGTRFAVVVLPDRWTIDGPGVGQPMFRDSITSRVPEIAGRLGIPYFDAGNVVREAVADGESMYLGPNDCHFNATGHQIMARWLDPRIAGLSSHPVR